MDSVPFCPPELKVARSNRAGRTNLFYEIRAYIYSPEELRTIYNRLPSYDVPFVRFAVHTGMRLREITTLTWGNVDLEKRVAHVEARFAKNGRPREVTAGATSNSRENSARVFCPERIWPTNCRLNSTENT